MEHLRSSRPRQQGLRWQLHVNSVYNVSNDSEPGTLVLRETINSHGVSVVSTGQECLGIPAGASEDVAVGGSVSAGAANLALLAPFCKPAKTNDGTLSASSGQPDTEELFMRRQWFTAG